jgi:hypothetical protein
MRIVAVFLAFTSAMALLSCGPVDELEEPIDFKRFERNVFSQSGEDGVIQKIFEVIEPTSRFAVEFGALDGIKNSNTRRLVVEEGWSSFQIEGDPERAAALAKNFADYPKVRTLEAWVWPGNIEILFEENGVPTDLDFLVIDIDSNDYYVWRVMHTYRPKVVQIEYNRSYPAPELAVIKYHPMNYWDRTDYHGASIQSLVNLGKRKGYELIYSVQGGGNLFFVDERYFPRFAIEDNSAEKFYRLPNTGFKGAGRAPNGHGFPIWEKNPKIPIDAFEIEKKVVAR